MKLGKWKVDLGADEVREGLYQIQIYQTEDTEETTLILQSANKDTIFKKADEIVSRLNFMEG